MKHTEIIVSSRKRIVLSVYLDLMSFGILTAYVTYLLPYQHNLLFDWAISIPIFAIIQLIFYKKFNQTIGFFLLSIYRVNVKLDEQPVKVCLVDPSIKKHESWITLLIGVIFFNNGIKQLTRWTTYGVAQPFFGAFPSNEIYPLIAICLGLIEIFIALSFFKLFKFGYWVAVFETIFLSTSAIISKDLWPQFIENYSYSKANYTGLPVSLKKIEFAQSLLPYSVIGFGLFLILLMILSIRRFDQFKESVKNV